MRGNLDGAWGPWGSVKHTINSGSESVVLQSGNQRISDIPNAPAIFELIDKTKNPERTREILNAWDALNLVGIPVATTPGTPMARVQFLRNAFQLAMHDPDFLQTIIKADRPIDYVSGEEMIDIIRNATGMDKEIEQLFINAIRGEL